MIYQCDYGNETAKEVRRLPIGDPEVHAGLYVCRTHFIKETLGWPVLKRPSWDELPLQYADDNKEKP